MYELTHDVVDITVQQPITHISIIIGCNAPDSLFSNQTLSRHNGHVCRVNVLLYGQNVLTIFICVNIVFFIVHCRLYCLHVGQGE